MPSSRVHSAKVHSFGIARQICLPWWCFSFAPLFMEKGAIPGQPCLVRLGDQLVSAKLTKLDALIKALLGNRRVPRKTLEQCIRLLIWATSIALHLRSWLAPLYSDLNSSNVVSF